MTVGELKERLEDFDDELEIRLATQPSWPLRFRLAGVTSDEEAFEYSYTPEEQDERGGEPSENFLWLVEGGTPHDESPYAPRYVWDAC